MVIKVCMEGGDIQHTEASINKEYRRALDKIFKTDPNRQYKTILWQMCGGREQVDKEFRKVVQSRLDTAKADRETILMLKDSDGRDLADLRKQVCDGMSREVKATINAETDIHFMVQEIEAWFLADKNLIFEKYHTSPEQLPEGEPQNINNPKEVLKTLSGNKYNEKRAPELLREMDREVVYNSCPAFMGFDERLKNA